jgi:hypothetical protein
MGIMDMFKSAAPATTPAATSAATVPTTGVTTDPTTVTTNIPPTADAAVSTGEASPLDNFSKLWETDPNDKGTENTPFSLGADPKKIAELAGKTDFRKVVNQDILTRINAGGADAMTALQEAMNNMSQAVYAQSAIASTKIVEQAIAKAQERFEASIPDQVRRHTASDNLRTEHPVFKHPATQPLLDALQQQLAIKNPGATAAELSKQAKDYMTKFADAMKGKETSTTQTTSNEEDWSDFL